jgi:hypothetical protein
MVGVTLAVTWPLATQLTSSAPGDYGDPVFVMWVMGWVAGQLTAVSANASALNEFWNANIFFPESETLAFSEHFIAQTVTVLPVYWSTGNLILSYNVAFLASFILTGLGTFLLARELTGSASGAILAATIAAFNQYRLVFELSHLHVLSIQWLPFALFALHRYFETDSRRYLVYAAAALIALNLSSIYFMAYCAPFVLLFAFGELVRTRRWRTPRVWLELWATAALVVVATMPFVLPYLAVQQRLGVERAADEVIRYSGTLDQYQFALPGLLPALVTAAIAIIGIPFQRTVRLRWATGMSLLLLVLAFWLSLGPTIHGGGQALDFPGLYGLLYDYVPGYRGLRVPARFAALLFIFLGLLAGAAVALLENRWGVIGRLAMVVVFVIFVSRAAPDTLPLNQPLPSPGLEPPPPYLTPRAELPSVYRTVESLRPGAILAEFPFGDSWYEVRYMYFAATHRRRLLNGYSGIFPPSYLARQKVLARPTLDPERAAQALGAATHVIVHRAAWKDNTGAVVGAWLETIGAKLIAEPDGAALYELPVREELAGRDVGSEIEIQPPGDLSALVRHPHPIR